MEKRIAEEKAEEEARLKAEEEERRRREEEERRRQEEENAKPKTVEKSNPIKWALVGTGSALTVGFGAVTAVTYANSRGFIDEGDQASFENIKPLNNLSFALTGVGLVTLGVGLALPSKRTVSAVTFAPAPDGFIVAGRF